MKTRIAKFFDRSSARISSASSIMALMLLATLLCGGCARRYSITTNKGYVITTRGKPEYDKMHGSWVYSDMAGKKHVISTGSVTMVQPESMVSEKDSPAHYTPAAKN